MITTTTQSTLIDQVQQVVKSGEVTRIDGLLVDPDTARNIVTLYGSLSPNNRERLRSMSIRGMVVAIQTLALKDTSKG